MRIAPALIALVTGGISSLAFAQITQLVPSGAQEDGNFGASVCGVKVGAGAALRDNAVVGSPSEDLPGGFFDAGRVRVYDSLTGALVVTIDPPNKQPGGQFGYAVAGLERINAGEFGDVLVGAPMQRPGVGPAIIAFYGRAYIFDGNTGQMLRAIKSPAEQSFGHFGWAAAALGDLNGDGYTEYAVSAPGELVFGPGPQIGGIKAGRVHVFNGQTGALLRTLVSPLQAAEPVMFSPFDPTGHLNFGYSLAGVPDATGDGKTDILVGAPGDKDGAGRAYLFNGVTGALVRTFASPSSMVGGRFGESIAGMADVNGDGRGEVVIGAPGDRLRTQVGQPAPGQAWGRVYVFSGGSGVFVRMFTPPLSGANWRTGSIGFGTAVATVPDASGDNKPDVIIGAHLGGAGTTIAPDGRAYVMNGVTGATVQALSSPQAELGGQFGSAVAGLRMPGRDSILAGAEWEDPGYAPRNSGRAYILTIPPLHNPTP